MCIYSTCSMYIQVHVHSTCSMNCETLSVEAPCRLVPTTLTEHKHPPSYHHTYMCTHTVCTQATNSTSTRRYLRLVGSIREPPAAEDQPRREGAGPGLGRPPHQEAADVGSRAADRAEARLSAADMQLVDRVAGWGRELAGRVTAPRPPAAAGRPRREQREQRAWQIQSAPRGPPFRETLAGLRNTHSVMTVGSELNVRDLYALHVHVHAYCKHAHCIHVHVVSCVTSSLGFLGNLHTVCRPRLRTAKVRASRTTY